MDVEYVWLLRKRRDNVRNSAGEMPTGAGGTPALHLKRNGYENVSKSSFAGMGWPGYNGKLTKRTLLKLAS
jgi:hypothetical protein